MSDSRRVFDEIVRHAHEQPLVIFDLDSTLYNVSHRTQKIMEAFAREPEMSQAFPEEVARLPNVKVELRDWGMKEAFIRAAFKASDKFAMSIRDYWNKHFFSSLFLHEDKPYPGAVEYVNALDKAGAQIWYLT